MGKLKNIINADKKCCVTSKFINKKMKKATWN